MPRSLSPKPPTVVKTRVGWCVPGQAGPAREAILARVVAMWAVLGVRPRSEAVPSTAVWRTGGVKDGGVRLDSAARSAHSRQEGRFEGAAAMHPVKAGKHARTRGAQAGLISFC